VSEDVFLVDGSRLLADVARRFADAVASARYEDAERYAELAFYLLRNRVDMGEP
jgi:hypothetical protein